MLESLETRVRLVLTRGVGRCIAGRLRTRFGSLESVFQADEASLLTVEGVHPELAARIVDPALADEARREIDAARAAGWSLESPGEPGYPPDLAEIFDPPLLLFRKGDIPPAGSHGHPGSLAVVGSRRATNQGLRLAEQFGEALVRAGWTVTSGLARGIDSAAHRGALRGGGRTVAVLGNGWDTVYPRENRGLLDRLLDAGGAVLTEFPRGTPPLPENFPRRNRIIAGTSHGVLVVEAAVKSGSLITAGLALDGGREVFAVPGSIETGRSWGCHDLIRDGARIVQSPSELLADLGTGTSPEARLPEGPGADGTIIGLLRQGELGIDEIAEEVDLRPSELAMRLLRLELAGAIRRYPGRRFALASR